MPYLSLAETELYYEEEGHGSPVLLLHNYFGTVASWARQRDALSASFHVVLADARGHGRSRCPGGRLRLTDFMADAAALIEQLGLAPLHVVGSSLGALTGLGLAERHPWLVATLTAIDPPHLDESTCRTYMDRIVDDSFPADPAGWEAPHRHLGPHHVRDVLLPNFAADRDEQPADQLHAVLDAGRIGCPTLLVAGDRDPVFPLTRAIEIRDRIAEAELLVLPRGGHFPHRTRPSVFNEVLVDFLKRRSADVR